MFKKILIANRGEIALRVIHTCKEMGIKTVAVYSEADTNAKHVHAADEAVYLGPSQPSASYLNFGKLFEAAKKSGAQAVHPGYGFVSENCEFAQRCQNEDIIFIGPPAEVIRRLGDKLTARRIMLESGVPVIPGLTHVTGVETMLQECEAIGYPVLVKAAAGGGGKGIRRVDTPEALSAACDTVSREAAAAFGDSAVYVEKFLQKARHVEFQIIADAYGNVIHLLERECSIQRRHQKIIEETPSTALTPRLRRAMGDAAVAAARAAGYINAGTVEFILVPEGKFYFLEVNTRLQVEHPITEMVTGIDIVRQQIEIAAGSRLSLRQEEIFARGHAIECRIYAEDPQNNFFPSAGEITFLQEPAGPGIRNDCGIYEGCKVPVEYDPILSKLVAHGQSRDIAIQRMIHALEDFVVMGVETPIPFLLDVLKSIPFSEGETHTDFIESHFAQWEPSLIHSDLARIAFIVDELTQNSGTITNESTSMKSPWQTLGRWRP